MLLVVPKENIVGSPEEPFYFFEEFLSYLILFIDIYKEQISYDSDQFGQTYIYLDKINQTLIINLFVA